MNKMADSLEIVMLVDDNDTDNFIHKRVIELTGFAKNIIVKSLACLLNIQKSLVKLKK